MNKIKDSVKEKYEKWEKDFKRTKDEIEAILSCKDRIKNIGGTNGHFKNEDPNAQNLITKFLTIHLCNYYVYSVRKKIIELNPSSVLCFTVFNNASYTPTTPIMKSLLTKIINDQNTFDTLNEKYNILVRIRNKFAHADTEHEELKNISIDIDEFNNIFELINQDILQI